MKGQINFELRATFNVNAGFGRPGRFEIEAGFDMHAGQNSGDETIGVRHVYHKFAARHCKMHLRFHDGFAGRRIPLDVEARAQSERIGLQTAAASFAEKDNRI